MKKEPGILFASLKDIKLEEKDLKVIRTESTWRKEDSLKYLSLSTRGLFNTRWIKSLNGAKLSSEARFFLSSLALEGRHKADFELVFVDGDKLNENGFKDCSISRAREFARKKGLLTASPRALPALCELFLHKIDEIERPAKLILMHEALLDELGRPYVLSIDLLANSILIDHRLLKHEAKHLHGKVYFIFSSRVEEAYE